MTLFSWCFACCCDCAYAVAFLNRVYHFVITLRSIAVWWLLDLFHVLSSSISLSFASLVPAHALILWLFLLGRGFSR